MVLVRNGSNVLAASRRPVSRDEYARFVAATGREESLCRERASLLRIVAPRTWKSPGFKQSGSQPVVCVSWDDAERLCALAGPARRPPLPPAARARGRPAARRRRRQARSREWNSDCSGDCGKHISSGASWRGGSGARALDASRGYDDVGIRLVSDLPQAMAKR